MAEKKMEKTDKLKKAIKKITALKAPKKSTKKVSKTRKIIKANVQKTPTKNQQLGRYDKNPIIKPNQENNWESKATFNPAALYHNGKTHLLYRAIGDNDMSVLGYAGSIDGLNFNERSSTPAYFHKMSGEKKTAFAVPYSSGGGWNGGCEDPRLVLIDGMVYLTYTAFDGWGSIRIALTSISLRDFLEQNWNWKKPIMISPINEIHKNWVMFPEKINGKYAILHSISPKILIDYVDNPNDENVIKSRYEKSERRKNWDNWTRGAGAPPIKTKDGWLLLYHGMDDRDPNRYKLGAMLLDLKDPSKILYRSNQPILEPDAYYENEGFKAGVVYSCGATVIGNRLFIYYGGADKVVCVAEANLESFLKDLKKNGAPKLEETKKIKKIR